MQKTIYSSPFWRKLIAYISGTVLRLKGWTVVGEAPTLKKYVIIALPHATNWDFPFALSFAFIKDYRLYWLGKSGLFKWPFGGFMRWMGGVAVDRSKKTNLVAQIIQEYENREELGVIIPPEGTRSNVTKWKTGFYHIAVGANVPIIFAFVDYKNKIGGFGPTFYPTGDIDTDLKEIRRYYEENGYIETIED